MARQRSYHNSGNIPQQSGDAIHSEEWGGISSKEHDEAISLEAAYFGGVPEGTSYRFPYAPYPQTGLDRSAGSNPRPVPGPTSPSLMAQRLLREQQDDEYLASLQADREKELKAVKKTETHRSNEGESFRKVLEEEEFERRLAAKETSLPQEPPLDNENAVTLLVRMPNGTRHGRRFLKSDKLQSLFDFIDVGKAVKPGTYRVVRPYPRRAFSVDDNSLTLDELGLTSKQEALFLELI
ncbi:hypothetical protein L1049_018344 [Liquidambar formosana]|uniref:UBX domain-containing protein n=1 Tax=Liquidambar formosana TaxID=63359 RepID=A0AAP0WM42_LIQFO